ncbi:fibronectin type III domain-containing protein [Patescibacteria group bacterium]|nr:fibronectin type III domain-containing protein [Patescibacteria group bacterium]MCG2700208.1 fibronectin type III domain-containing protein [Candidatus Parcubacteria bacterium]
MVFAISDEASVSLEVTSTCNNNGVCEPNLEESELGCSADCGCNNNGVCQSARGEDTQNCSADCHPAIGGGGVVALHIRNISIKNITFNSVNISWQTTRPTLCTLSWGMTSEYEKEIISGTRFTANYSTKLTGLQVSTIYHFKIVCNDELNFWLETGDQYFSTLSALNNVSNLKISVGDKQLTLTWDNPTDLDFKMVRIVKSTDFYPTDPEQGTVIYEGKDNFFINTGLINGIRYYYTVFVYNLAGDHSSSGAIVSAIPQAAPVIEPPVFPPYVPPITGEMAFGEFNFIVEEGEIIWLGETTIKTTVNKQINVSIYDKELPPLSKTIILTIEKKDEAFSFLLSPDKSKTFHEATIPSSLESGDYSITILILNQINKVINKISGELKLERAAPVFRFRWYYELPIYIIIVLAMIILITFGLGKEQKILLMIKRRKNKSKYR